MAKILSIDEVVAKLGFPDEQEVKRHYAAFRRFRVALEKIAQRGCDSAFEPPYEDRCSDYNSGFRCPACLAKEALHG